ncbi:hypothetical protein [Xenorhabdus mauleonii]|uniref:hypothetical protein n=1 Tax=Xenorhabdus mauleonii TaxID=351675 RepID=UPI0011138C68|nr:hypothetical protein [Xenorhabdus mauleonii]
MAGLTHGVPVKSGVAAQSLFNIMSGNCAKFAVQPRHPQKHRAAAHIAQYTLCLAPPLIGIAGCGAQGCAFCCKPLSRSSAIRVLLQLLSLSLAKNRVLL